MDTFKNDIDRIYGVVKETNHEIHKINEQITILRIEVAQLKLKSGLWGVFGGAVVMCAMLLRDFLSNH